MKESSQVIMGATLIMAASLAIVLGLILVLLAELYCSLLLRRRRRCHSQQQQLCDPARSYATVLSTISLTIPSPSSVYPSTTPSPLSSFYAHGVLHAPRSLLFPALRSPSAPEKHYHLSEGTFEAGSSSPSFNPLSLPSRTIPEECPSYQLRPGKSSHLVYISNPIYDDAAADTLNHQLPNTPFETPDSSPSVLDSGSSSGADDEARAFARSGAAKTPPLTPMKKLPSQACSVPLRDASSMCTSKSDSNTNRGLLSSSSSGTPCTSPSW